MWIKINNQIVNATLIRHISEIQEVSPERFHNDRLDAFCPVSQLDLGIPLVDEWRRTLHLAGLYLGTETKDEPWSREMGGTRRVARWRVVTRTDIPGETVKEEFVDDWKPFYFFTVKLRQQEGNAIPLISITSHAYATKEEASEARDKLAKMLNELEASLPSIEI